MKLLARKTMAVITATLMMLSVFANTANVFGLDYGEGSPLSSLYKADKYDTKTAEEVIRDTYWANLEEGSVKGKFRNLTLDDRGVIIGKDQNKTSQLLEMVAEDLRGSISKGVFPKYLLKPNETALKDLPIDVDQFWDVQNLLSTGITDSNLGVMDSATYMLSSLGYLLGDTVNIEGSSYYGKNASDPISDKVNPYKFKESDLISQDEINNPKKLTVYADIKKTGDSDSSAIGTFEQEEELKLDFLLKGDWIKRFVMGYTLNITREYDSEETIRGIFERMYGMIDSQLVYTIDIPNEVEVKNPSAKISGLDGFKVTTDVKDESGNKRLVVSLRLDESIQGKKLKWSETIEKIKKLDTSNPVLSISGLYVKSTVNPDTKVTLKASLGGYVDWATKGLAQGTFYKANKPVSEIDNPDYWDDYSYEPDPSRYDNTYEAYNRTYLYFVGKQSDAGRDQAAPVDKPNLISYKIGRAHV